MQLIANSLPKPTKAQIAAWALLLAITLIIALFKVGTYQVGTHYDDARYIVLAKSLFGSEQYGMINLAGEPGLPWYPFVFPLFLSPIAALNPADLNVFNVISILATVAIVVILFWGWPWFSRRSHWWAVAIVGLFSLSPLAVDQMRRVMSEPLFVALVLIVILLTEQAARGKRIRGWSLFFGLTLTLALFTRTIGVILVISTLAYLIYRTKLNLWKELLLAFVAGIVSIGFIIAVSSVRPVDLLPKQYLESPAAYFLVELTSKLGSDDPDGLSPSHVGGETGATSDEEGSESLTTMVKNLLLGMRYHIRNSFRKVVLPLGGGDKEQALADNFGVPFLPHLIGMVIFALLLVGFTRWIYQEGLSAFNLFGILYLGALLVWLWEDPRLLYPIIPQLFYAFLVAIEGFLAGIGKVTKQRVLPQGFRDKVMAAVIVALVLLSAYQSITIDDSRLHTTDLRQRSAWLSANTPESAVVMTESPSIDFIYSLRKNVFYPPPPKTTEELVDYLKATQVDYVLIAPLVTWQGTYDPSYSDSMAVVQTMLSEMTATNLVTLAHSSDDGWIQVYKIESQE